MWSSFSSHWSYQRWIGQARNRMGGQWRTAVLLYSGHASCHRTLDTTQIYVMTLPIDMLLCGQRPTVQAAVTNYNLVTSSI